MPRRPPNSRDEAGRTPTGSAAHAQHERVTVTVHGEPSAVLIATDDPESLEETITILSHPDTLQRLATSDAVGRRSPHHHGQ